ncbi:hypothetical protein AHF37_01928, partial [Paragonimus kellicotti]
DLDQLEYYCEKLYTTDDPVVRTQAEKACASLCDRRDCPSICQLLLQRSTSCYAQLIASTALTKYISNRDAVIPLTTRLEIPYFCLAHKHPVITSFSRSILIQMNSYPSFTHVASAVLSSNYSVVCCSEKLQPKFGAISLYLQRLNRKPCSFQSGQSSAVLVGVQLLNNLVSEMNQNAESDMTRIIFLQRKLSASFRDCLLLPIFRLSLNLLREADKNIQSLDFTDVNQHGLVSQSLQLFHACLTFDFIGTTAGTGSFLGDDSSNGLDDLVVIQIPTSWRSIFLDTDTVPLFFRLYRGLPPELSTLVLSCLVQLASVRRSLFTNPERTTFLSGLVNGTRNILAAQSSTLADQNIYHEFCRLLSRLKCNFQLTELAALDCYVEFIQLLTAFTIHTLKSFHKESNHNNSLHYLLALWQRLVASVPYVQSPDSDLMEDAASQISRAYIEACLASVTDYVNCPTRVRVTSAKQRTSHTSHNLWPFASGEDTKATELADGSSENDDDMECPLDDMTTLLQQLEQLVRLTTNRLNMTSASQLSRDISTPSVISQLNHSPGASRLEMATLSFFEQFRRMYVGESVGRMSRVYQRLSEVLGISDDLTVLGVFANKIVTNIKYWSSNEPILNRTLNLLSELSRGYTAMRKLIRLDDIQFVLTNHNEEHFSFLATKAGTSSLSPARQAAEFRLRTSFYASLARLLMVDLGENEDRFLKFMAPLTRSTNRLIIALLSGGPSHMSPDEIKSAIVGLARDLRGLSSSLNTKSSYQMLLDWFYPMGFKLFGRALELWSLDPIVSVSVLKLLAEIVHNRNGRLLFDPTVPTGYLLFTELSRVLTAFGKSFSVPYHSYFVQSDVPDIHIQEFAIIGRCKYAKTCALLVQLFDEAAGSYEKALTMVTQGSSVDGNLLQVIRLDEHRLAWLVYMVGSLIGSRVNYTNADDDCDGELVCRVLQLVRLTTNRLNMTSASQLSRDISTPSVISQLNHSPGASRLEMATLSFFEQFRRMYVGESVGRMSRVYQRLSEVLGISDDLTVLGVFANKIVTNIKYWSSNEPILNRTLNLLSELSRGYTAMRKLIRLDDIQFVLTNHNVSLLLDVPVVVGTRCLQLIPNTRELPKQSVYQVKLKPIVAALDALKVCLSGSFINFGVFSLFREESLEKAVEMGVQLMLCVDESELQEFPKVAHSFFSLLEYLVNDHMPFVASLGGVLVHFLNTIANNILSTDTTIAENCCLCLDYILTHVFKLVQHEQHSNLLSDGSQISTDESLRLVTLEDDSSVSNGNTTASKKYGASRYAVWSTRTPVAEANLLDLVKLSSDGLSVPASLNLLRRILVILLSSVIQEDCRIQWSMTRPLLPLILLNNEYYLELRNRVIANLPVGRQQAMTKLFDKLMDEVEFNLAGKNRDKFTQNVSSFKLALGEFVKSMYSKSTDDMDSSSTAGGETVRNGSAEQCASEYLCLSTAIIQTAGLGLVL